MTSSGSCAQLGERPSGRSGVGILRQRVEGSATYEASQDIATHAGNSGSPPLCRCPSGTCTLTYTPPPVTM